MTPAEIRQWAMRRVPEFLASVARAESFFPRDVQFGRMPATSAFETLKESFSALKSGEDTVGYRVDWEERQTARWGKQKFPARVWFDDEPSFVRAAGCAEAVSTLRTNMALTAVRCPALIPWIHSQSKRIAECSDGWESILEVACYFLANPKPRLYPRQLPLPIHTKFIDQNRDILRPVLDFLIAEHIQSSAQTFNGRFHLLEDEAPVRMRFLDRELAMNSGLRVLDIAQPLSQFCQFDPLARVAIVVENKICFLTLPPLVDAIAIWGGGKAAALLHNASWLQRCRLIYWGDMDDTGYNILSRLRHDHPHTESVLMDERAWLDHQKLARPGKLDAITITAPNLTPSETNAWQNVRTKGLMIEQEQIPVDDVTLALVRCFGCSPEH